MVPEKQGQQQDRWGLEMTAESFVVSQMWTKGGKVATFDALGAAERRVWSSCARRSEIDAVLAAIDDSANYGVVVIGPWGVGKTTLARAVESELAKTFHVVKIFGSASQTPVSYGPLAMLLARLPIAAAESPTAIIRGIEELIFEDARGRPVLLVIDDLPALDPPTVGVLMHLLLSGTAKVLALARESNDLPEDLVWLAKDGMLGEVRLNYFGRAEVGELITKATKTFVSESAVTALYEASNGIPLVLQALFREQVVNGAVRMSRGGWVISTPINVDSTSALAEIVCSRLSRESAAVRQGLEKMSLLGETPLPVAMSVLGADTLSELEARGFLEIRSEGRRHALLSERYVGDTVRSMLSPERMAELLADIAANLGPDLGPLDGLETMSLAAWTLDAGLVMEPRLALAAAATAISHFDPLLALRATAAIPVDHELRVRAVQYRSAAYRILADYPQAVAELDSVPEAMVAGLEIADYGAWVLSLTGALLWVPQGCRKIPEILLAAEKRVVLAEAVSTHAKIRTARQRVRLAYFEYQVFLGEFTEILDELVAASEDDDVGYALNSSCLLVPVLAVVGRELEAIALGRRVESEAQSHSIPLRFIDYLRDGLAQAMMWCGLWQDCVEMLRNDLETMPAPVQYRGGLFELNLGLAHAYAGSGAAAVDVLMAATAQLEVRESDNALGLAYSALAFAYAQINNEEEALRCLAFANSEGGPTRWVNHSMAEFFRLMALRWLQDSRAGRALQASAMADIDKGRVTTASMSLFGGSIVNATDRDYELLEVVSLRRQGPMPAINVLLAQSCRNRDPQKALMAAAQAQKLKLDAVESRCAVLALDFATEQGKTGLAKEARERLERLSASLAKMPVSPQTNGVALTQRELQVARLAKLGLGNRAIADRIGVSVRTVEGHIYQVYSKLGITTRLELGKCRDL